MFKKIVQSLFLTTFLFGLSAAVSAAPITQSLTLKPGWTAVFLEVEPADPDPAAVFAGVPDLISVWAWNPLTSPVEFIQNPSAYGPGHPYMLAWFPDRPAITSLHAVHGERAYLVRRDEAATGDFSWAVTGEPVVPGIKWQANSFNLVGFHLEPGAGPLFHDFFSSSEAHAGQEIYRLDSATATWVEVTSPADQMEDGEAFWVYCRGASEFNGPLAVQLTQSDGLHFGDRLVEQAVEIRNDSAADRTVTVSVSSADTALHYRLFEPATGGGVWVDLFNGTAPLTSRVAAGERQAIRLGVVRAGLQEGATYLSNLAVSDGAGMRILIPVSTQGSGKEGLWVGDATLTKVSEPRVSGTPVPAGSEFSFRLIVHLDGTDTARLLGEVVQLWQEGTWKADPDNLGRLIVDQPGTFVLVTNDTRLGEFQGAALRDGQPVGRRVSSPAFPFAAPLAATGGAFALGSVLSFDVDVAPDDPSNPFLHRDNPDHTAGQSYRVRRQVSLDFGNYNGDGNLLTGVSDLSWGSTEVGGVYRETLKLWNQNAGDQPYTVHSEGTFLLRRVSDVGTLEL